MFQTTNQKCILKRQITSEEFIGQLLAGLHPVSPIALQLRCPIAPAPKSSHGNPKWAPEVNITC